MTTAKHSKTESNAAPVESAGTAYGMAKGHHDARLTEVGPGTPCGEFLRRYWLPVALSAAATTTPREVRALGEDLILFRDRQGRPGLLYPRCSHRGTSLLYGKAEDEGLRCCYHGWLFGVDGTCVEMPCEPPTSTYKTRIRQPWYEVLEQYGLIWAYMGPPDRKPLLPKYDIFENLAENEYLEPNDLGASTGGLGKHFVAPWNWVQNWENNLDPAHVRILHVAFSGFQFTSDVPTRFDPWKFEYVEDGVTLTTVGYFDDGRRLERNFEVRFPTQARIADPMLRPGPMRTLLFTLPVDDTHFMVYAVRKQVRGQENYSRLNFGGKSWDEMTDAERRDTPGDFEAQSGQGRITFHSEENLASTDRGVIMVRRALRKQIDVVEAGLDPAGVNFDPAKQLVHVGGGNLFT
jgi:phenylpropionate dioxygenase-like ring-hydroxylating dioxygenase large terminal subunit